MNNEPSANIRSLSVDGLRMRTAQPGGESMTGRPVKRVYFRPKPAGHERRLPKKLELPLLLAACTLGGFLAGNVAIGLGLLAIYGIFAFAARIPSRTTFTLALLLLAAISILLLFKPDQQLIQNFATYSFVLLLIGVITLGREAKLPKRMPRKYRR